MWGVVGMGEDRGELTGTGQGSWQPQAGQDRVGTAGSMAQDQEGAGRIPLRWGSSSCLRSSSMQARSHRGRQDRQGSTGCHGAQVQAAATLGRGTGRQWDAGKVQGSRQGVGRVLPAPAGCRQQRHGQGAGGPGQGAGATGRVQAGCDITLEEGGDVPGADAPLLHELPQGHLQEEDGNAAHEDDEQEVPLMQALGAGRQGERSLPFACCAWWVPWEPRAGCVQYFCRQGKTGNAVEGQPGRAGTAHPPAAGTT